MQQQQQQQLRSSQIRRQSSNSALDEQPFLKFLAESNYLESEQSSQEKHQKLTKCKTEHSLQPIQFLNSNSFTVSDKKFSFPTNEILEWETLQITLPPEVYQFLLYMKTQCSNGTIVYTNEQIQGLLDDSKVIIKNQLELFQKLIDKDWISKTTRLFNDIAINFYALSVKKLTYENLVWIIRSIKRDLITPTERLVQSRIKECYGLKYNRIEWELIMNQLKSQKQQIKFRSSNGKLIELPLLQVKNIKDPLIQEETYGIYIYQQNWIVEDEFQPELDKKQEWTIFIEFLMDFFAKTNAQNNKILKGGRYGCAQFIKLLGPKKLRELSLGRLTLYVQMAVNKNYIRYNKTILIQESREKSEHTTDSSVDGDPQIKLRVQELQEQLIELLLENPDGVSLAQIPTLLKERVNFELNLIELGFPKLKNFIESVKDVITIENSGRNNFIAKLNYSKLPKKYQKIKQSESFTQKYIYTVLQMIKNILSKHKYGISINQLYYDLSQQLGEWFNYQRFQCQSFFQFLQNYAENILVIVCQKGNQYLIYERDLRFLPPPQPTQDINDQQFEYILSEAFQCSLGLSIPQSSFSNSWLGKVGDSQIRQKSPPRIEDSHQEIKDNLKFIDELLGNENKQNDTYSIQDWSEKSMNPLGMISSINYGHSEIQDFDLTKELQFSIQQQQNQDIKKK
ncbi:unnamed protein product [Paramecium primaurelia]|uniref:HTH OST-type domain-containing protein n=1 Tax=Paramecium primaurelia TaxID=5886 RepID=A0A8S1K4P2_PARPR|nr:unnamed protein product [Paramecium primaurelia]